MKYIDLTHTFTDNMPVYPGDPAATLSQAAAIASEGYTDHLLHTHMHVGTHMDAPLHMIPGGQKMHELSLEKFFGRGVLLDARGQSQITAATIGDRQIQAGDIVLIYTGFGSVYREAKYYEAQPTVSEEFAEKMVELGVKVVGMDILGPDQPPFPTHKILLGNGILIVENLANLDQLLEVQEFEIVALPVKLAADAAPVRIVAVLKG